MPSERFYIDKELEAGETVFLEGNEFHHLAHVMRVRVGEEIELVNGKGSLATARLVAIEKRGGSIEILSCVREEMGGEGVVLAVPLMRPAKLEWVLEKGTELGAAAFWLYSADLSEKEDLSPNQMQRLQTIAISAMKQCGRLDLPRIERFEGLSQILASPFRFLFGDPRGEILAPCNMGKIVFITGPEKGFSKKEQALLEQKAKGVRLHKNILRAETAPLVAVILFK